MLPIRLRSPRLHRMQEALDSAQSCDHRKPIGRRPSTQRYQVLHLPAVPFAGLHLVSPGMHMGKGQGKGTEGALLLDLRTRSLSAIIRSDTNHCSNRFDKKSFSL